MIIALAALLLFGGRGKLSGIMGDAAKGIKAFRDGMKDDHETTMPSAAAASSLPRAQTEKDRSTDGSPSGLVHHASVKTINGDRRVG